MKFTETVLKGAFVIDLAPRLDERGFFARAWCAREFEQGLNPQVVQANLSHNQSREPYAVCTIRCRRLKKPSCTCVRGAVYDVIVDIRPDSRTYLSVARHRADGGKHEGALCAGRLCARISDAGGRQRRVLSGDAISTHPNPNAAYGGTIRCSRSRGPMCHTA